MTLAEEWLARFGGPPRPPADIYTKGSAITTPVVERIRGYAQRCADGEFDASNGAELAGFAEAMGLTLNQFNRELCEELRTLPGKVASPLALSISGY